MGIKYFKSTFLENFSKYKCSIVRVLIKLKNNDLKGTLK